MFERFTDRARRVVVLAQEESRLLNHNYIGTEHILLGLVHEGEGVGAKALEELGISLNRARERVLEIIGHGGSAPSGHIPFTPRAKKVLELSLREALELGHNYIGTEHILLGLIREGEGVGAQVLIKMGADLSTVRTKVIQLLSGYAGTQSGGGPTITVTSPGPASATAVLSGGPHLGGCAFCGRDVWELDRFVAAPGVLICDACVAAAQQVIANAAEGEGRGLALPPRVFGELPDPRALDDITTALEAVFGGGDDDRCADHLEDGARLAPLRADAGARFPQYASASVQVDRIRFDAGDRAELRFRVVPRGEVAGLTIAGVALRRDGRWVVARDTFCRVMQIAGVTCPPPEEPDA